MGSLPGGYAQLLEPDHDIAQGIEPRYGCLLVRVDNQCALFIAGGAQAGGQIGAHARAEVGIDDVEVMGLAVAGLQLDARRAGPQSFDAVANQPNVGMPGQCEGLPAGSWIAVAHHGDPVAAGAQENGWADGLFGRALY